MISLSSALASINFENGDPTRRVRRFRPALGLTLDGGGPCEAKATTSVKFGGHRERFGGVDHKHDESRQIDGTGPISATFVPSGVATPCCPSVNSHALPAASAVSDGQPW